MPKIHQLSPHVANLIAAGEVVERPASVVKELLENAVDAGASTVTVELRNGGMTFLRVTDNGCGMAPEDAKTAFLRHATSKLQTAEDLSAIVTMGFRGEALAAIASVSRIDLLTKTAGAVEGASLHLEAGAVTEESEAGCPEGTTIIVRDLFFNTPARMKFMKADTVEGAAASAVVQKQALAHPDVAFRLIRDGKEILNAPGDGKLLSAAYAVYGKEAGAFIPVDSHWEKVRIQGFVSKPTDSRNSRNFQVFFVGGRPVKSKLLTAALEEAYRNQIMVGKFPACVLHITLPPNAVDVNVHPAKTEVKFLSEREVFDCVHYGVLAALGKTADRPTVSLGKEQAAYQSAAPAPQKKENFFRTMTAEEYKVFSQAVKDMPRPQIEKAQAVLQKAPNSGPQLRENVSIPMPSFPQAPAKPEPTVWQAAPASKPSFPEPVTETPLAEPKQMKLPQTEETEQVQIPLDKAPDWRIAGELFSTYILVEQGADVFFIDKHAAHERILFDKLRSQPQELLGQQLLSPLPCRLGPEAAATILAHKALLSELGYEAEPFGEDTILLRQIPMELSTEQAAESIAQLAEDLKLGRREDRDTLRDELLHTIACKAAIKGGWHTDKAELQALVETVMSREDLKYCPHGRPICVKMTKSQLERRFGRA